MVASQIFVNLPVKNLDASIAFFTKLGFTFNPQFTDQNATCMVIGENIFAMLLVEPFFKTFTKKDLVDARTHAEAILALGVASKQHVDELIAKALKFGAIEPGPTQDHGWMYGRGFQDLDGHLWEVFWMDPKGPPAQE